MEGTVSLDDELAHVVEGRIAIGRFRTPSDVVRGALRLMETIERQDADRLGRLRKAWQDGIDSGDAGEIDFTILKAAARETRAARGS